MGPVVGADRTGSGVRCRDHGLRWAGGAVRAAVGLRQEAGATSEVHLEPEVAPCAFRIVGKVEAWGGSQIELIALLQRYGGELGVSGIQRVRCGAPGTIGQGRCDGDAYVCK